MAEGGGGGGGSVYLFDEHNFSFLFVPHHTRHHPQALLPEKPSRRACRSAKVKGHAQS